MKQGFPQDIHNRCERWPIPICRRIKAVTAATTLTNRQTGTIFHNRGAGGSVTITLPAAPYHGVEFEFRVAEANALVIDPNGKLMTLAGTDFDDTTATADDEGESLVVTYDEEEGIWIGKQTGTWT